MAAGKPVIASRIGGLPCTVSDGLTGLLFEPGNAFDLAAKIGRLLDEPQLRNTLGLAGCRRFRRRLHVARRHQAILAATAERTGPGVSEAQGQRVEICPQRTQIDADEIEAASSLPSDSFFDPG